MTATVHISGLIDLIKFLNSVKDPSEWIPVENSEVESS